LNSSEKVSLLIFHKDSLKELSSLVKMCSAYVDEIVIIDSSTKLKQEAAKFSDLYGKGNKIKVFWAPPLGYPDPYRMWALRKCSYEWILYLDVDERPSQLLLQDLRHIIKTAEEKDYHGLRILRHELFRKKDAYYKHHYTIQIRLFKNSSTRFNGIVHEFPEINGSLGTLNPRKYYILHYTGLDWKNPVTHKKFKNYFILEVLSKPPYMPLLNASGLLAPIREFFLKYLPKSKGVLIIILILKTLEEFIYTFRMKNNVLFKNLLDDILIKILPYSFRQMKFWYKYFCAFIDFMTKNKDLIEELKELPLDYIYQQGITRALSIYNDEDIVRISEFSKRTNKEGIDLLISLIKSQLRDI